MSCWHRHFRVLSIAALIVAGCASRVSAQNAPPPQPTPGAASLLPADPVWVVNIEAMAERSAASEDSEPIASLRQFTYLAVLGYDADWACVLNPRTSDVGFVP